VHYGEKFVELQSLQSCSIH